MPFFVPGVVLPELSFTSDPRGNTTDLTTYSFLNVQFGAADAAREVIVYVNARSTGGGVMSISSATIGGVTATVHVSADAGSGTPRIHSFIISAPVPTGTTGTVSITFSAGASDCGIRTYRAINLQSSTPYHTATDQGDPASMSLNVPEGGISVGGAYHNATGAITTTGLTEDDDAVFDTTKRVVCGSASGLSAETARTISFDQGGAALAAGVCASWR